MQWVGAEFDLIAVEEPVSVGVEGRRHVICRVEWVGSVGEHLGAVVDGSSVGVRVERVGGEGVDFLAVEERVGDGVGVGTDIV